MTEQELRVLVREAIAKQLGGESGSVGNHAQRGGVSAGFAQFVVPSGPEGTCIIEPSVTCNHCGYCKSYGH